MKNNIIKIIAGLFFIATLTSCSQSDAYQFLRMGNKTGHWGNDMIDLFHTDDDDNDDWWDDDDDDDDDRSSNPGGGKSSSSNNNSGGKSSSSNNGGGKSSSSNNNGGSASQTGDTVDINNPYFDFSWNSSDHTASICFISGMNNPNPIVPITYVYNGENYRIIDDGKAPGFSYMMIVETITIQEGFEEIQNGFCHDMNLISVKLPSTLKKIHAAPFVNCSKLQKVEYNGTMAQWEAVQKNNDYNYGLPQDITIVCKDGNLTLPKDPDW